MADLDKVFDRHGSFSSIDELQGSRDNDLGQCWVDITRRDVEEGNFNIDITIYVRPDVDPNRVMPALQKTCIDIFGHSPGEDIELFYHPGQLSNGQAIGIEVDGRPGVFQSFGVTIKHPKSNFFSIDRLKSVFLKRAKHHLEQA